MSPVIFGCVICGYDFDDDHLPEEGWWLDYRIIYSSPDGFFLSGVGRRRERDRGLYDAPSDPTKRWDDDDYVPQPNGGFPVMKRQPEDGVHGFVIHDCCWYLLQKVLNSDDVPLERFVKICQSLPFTGTAINIFWGHTYGGLYGIDKNNNYPWYGLLTGPFYESTVGELALCNPVEVPEVIEMLQSTSSRPSETVQNSPSADCFEKIPWELREAIAIYLPTMDALNLRKASKAFVPLLSSQTFWASRFRLGGDRAFLFEKRNSPEIRDWLKLYRLTGSSQSPPGLRNRRRIWAILEGLAQLLLLRPSGHVSLDCTSPNPQAMNWKSVTGDLVYESNPSGFLRFQHGCRMFQKERVRLPRNLVQIGISKVGSGDHGYICGMSYTSDSGEVIRLGFTSQDNEIIFKVSKITGLILAMGSQGLKALKVIDDRGVAAEWVGSPLNTPITERLARFKYLDAVEVGIDGYKIVSIAAAGPGMDSESLLGGHHLSLRSTALWYPSVPSPDLHLNDESLTGDYPCILGYQPLIWTQFGGSKGMDLHHLTQLRLNFFDELASIEFGYEKTNRSIEAIKIGRHEMTEFCETQKLPIDGPGGEYIQRVYANTERSRELPLDMSIKQEKLHSLKIITNRGRSIFFESESISARELESLKMLAPEITPLKPLTITPGTTITGFYITQGFRECISRVGVISEVIKRKGETNNRTD